MFFKRRFHYPGHNFLRIGTIIMPVFAFPRNSAIMKWQKVLFQPNPVFSYIIPRLIAGLVYFPEEIKNFFSRTCWRRKVWEKWFWSPWIPDLQILRKTGAVNQSVLHGRSCWMWRSYPRKIWCWWATESICGSWRRVAGLRNLFKIKETGRWHILSDFDYVWLCEYGCLGR